MRSTHAFVAAVLAPCFTIVAQTFVVDANNGPGTNFTGLQAAITAVPSGAILLVRPGAYIENQVTIAAKSLTILGQSQSMFNPVDVVMPTGGPFSIQQLASGDRVVLRGLRLSGGGALDCSNNQGVIVLDQIDNIVGGSLSATNCAALLASNCFFPDPSACVNSEAIFTACQFGDGTLTTNTPAPAFRQTGGTVQMVDSRVDEKRYWLGPGAAVEMQTGDLRLLGATTIAAAPAVLSTVMGLPFVGSGTLRLEPTVQLIGAAPQIPATIVSTVQTMPVVAPVLIGSQVGASLTGPAGHVGILVVGFPMPPVPVSGALDPLWLDPTRAILMAIGSPNAAAAVAVPSSPALQGLTLAWQGATFDPAGGLHVSNPLVRVLW